MIIYETQVTYSRKEIPAVEILNAETAANVLREFALANITDPTKENLICVVLNTKNFVLDISIVGIGTVNQCLVRPAEILKNVLLKNGTAFILCHSHPSGDPSPSSADLQITRKIREAANALDITFFDHIVLGEKENDLNGMGYYSFKNAGIV